MPNNNIIPLQTFVQIIVVTTINEIGSSAFQIVQWATNPETKRVVENALWQYLSYQTASVGLNSSVTLLPIIPNLATIDKYVHSPNPAIPGGPVERALTVVVTSTASGLLLKYADGPTVVASGALMQAFLSYMENVAFIVAGVIPGASRAPRIHMGLRKTLISHIIISGGFILILGTSGIICIAIQKYFKFIRSSFETGKKIKLNFSPRKKFQLIKSKLQQTKNILRFNRILASNSAVACL